MLIQFLKWLFGGGAGAAAIAITLSFPGLRPPQWAWKWLVLSGFLIGAWAATDPKLQEKIVTRIAATLPPVIGVGQRPSIQTPETAKSTRALERTKQAEPSKGETPSAEPVAKPDGSARPSTQTPADDVKFNALLTLGQDQRFKKLYKECVATLSEAIERNSNSYYAYLYRGYCNRHANGLAASIADFTRAIEIDPTHRTGHWERGFDYLRERRFTESVIDTANAIRICPDCAALYRNRGVAYRNLKENEKAILDFKKALELDPFTRYPESELIKLGVEPKDIPKKPNLSLTFEELKVETKKESDGIIFDWGNSKCSRSSSPSSGC